MTEAICDASAQKKYISDKNDIKSKSESRIQGSNYYIYTYDDTLNFVNVLFLNSL